MQACTCPPITRLRIPWQSNAANIRESRPDSGRHGLAVCLSLYRQRKVPATYNLDPIEQAWTSCHPMSGMPPLASADAVPNPSTSNPEAYTLHATPYTLHPTPQTPNPQSKTPHPKHQNPHPKPLILHPKPQATQTASSKAEADERLREGAREKEADRVRNPSPETHTAKTRQSHPYGTDKTVKAG